MWKRGLPDEGSLLRSASLCSEGRPSAPAVAPPPDPDCVPLHDDLPTLPRRGQPRLLPQPQIQPSRFAKTPNSWGSAANGNLLRPFRPLCSHPTWDSQQLAPAENQSPSTPASVLPSQLVVLSLSKGQDVSEGRPLGIFWVISPVFLAIRSPPLDNQAWVAVISPNHKPQAHQAASLPTIEYGQGGSFARSTAPVPPSLLDPRLDICNHIHIHNHNHNHNIPSALGTNTCHHIDSPRHHFPARECEYSTPTPPLTLPASSLGPSARP